MYQTRELERICKKIVSSIDDELSRVGLFFRIFSRVKMVESIESKIRKKGDNYYDGSNKYIRDIIGVRVILYFSDDLDLVYSRLKDLFQLIEETVDKNEETKFAPTRVNMVFKLPIELSNEIDDIIRNPIVDRTFEVQLRTILSEGWHEIDHDLRYKCQEDWIPNVDLSRSLNGILATLETSEYSILRLFEQLSYRHYRSRDFTAMMRTKFRLRFIDYKLTTNLQEKLSDDFIKQLFKIDRQDVIKYLLESNVMIPLKLENLIYIVNHKFIHDENVLSITSDELLAEILLSYEGICNTNCIS